MWDNLFNSVIEAISISGRIKFQEFVICSVTSILLGALLALVYTFRNKYSKNFIMTIAFLPFAVQIIIMLVNGNIGASVAVAGTFTLVRFRSAPGNSREILTVLIAMTIGLANGMGYAPIAALFTAVVIIMTLIFSFIKFNKDEAECKDLRITVPENLDYTSIFDDLFEQYTSKCEVMRIKTTNMGSMYNLQYKVILKNGVNEKKFLDDIRCRNGNLTVSIAKGEFASDDSVL